MQINLIDPLNENDLCESRSFPDGSVELKLKLNRGIYQFSVVADGSEFDWQRLYRCEKRSDGKKIRTGPWDFDDRGLPCLPGYRVEVDGRFLGTWVFQRIHPKDLQRKRFRGRMAFAVCQGDTVTLRLKPVFDFDVPWMSARLETDPEDALEDDLGLSDKTAWAHWCQEKFWQSRRKILEKSPAGKSLQNHLQRVSKKKNVHCREGIVLFCGYRLWPDNTVLQQITELLEKCCRLPALGRTQEENGYGYGGDMDAMYALNALVQAHIMLRPMLANDLKEDMERTLTKQFRRFIDTALVDRDYWGGSLIQDHGWISISGATAALLNGRHFITDSDQMLSYLVPRTLRAYDAMPRDGVLRSKGDLWRYLDRPTDFRNAWLAASGTDIFQNYPFAQIMDFVPETLLEDGLHRISPIKDIKPLLGGSTFFIAMNELGFPHAAELARRTLFLPQETIDHEGLPEPARELNRLALAENLCNGVMVLPSPIESRKQIKQSRGMFFFADSGAVLFRHPRGRLDMSLKCGPYNGRHTYRKAAGPCDRISLAPGSGHFNVFFDGKPLLVTPETGWQNRSDLRTCLLIDGKGQRFGDLGYANCLPAWEHSGEDIIKTVNGTDTCRVVLDLAPAYASSSGVIAYRREFFLSQNEEVVMCCDRLRLARKASLCWLFQTDESAMPEPVGENGVLFDNRMLLSAVASMELNRELRPSPVVQYSRRDSGRNYLHIAYNAPKTGLNVHAKFTIKRYDRYHSELK